MRTKIGVSPYKNISHQILQYKTPKKKSNQWYQSLVKNCEDGGRR
jgi:hypothetical protein